MNKEITDKIQKTDELLANSRIGTILLAIIKLVNDEGKAEYTKISKLVFAGEDDTNKTAKLNHYMKLLQEEIKFLYFVNRKKKEYQV